MTMRNACINAVVETVTRASRRATTQLAGACRSRNIYNDDVVFELILPSQLENYQPVRFEVFEVGQVDKVRRNRIPGQVSGL
jgi:hypothetical protein